ncbi:MAG TPA: DNA-directed RNA polymerase subunit beta, partial [Patescibacteria group bacterium]|nr:DNA-directed RNA polymerase subunit beta [Patescibacteria group bacterium]
MAKSDPNIITTSRRVFGKSPSAFPLPNLIETQTLSFDWLLKEGIKDILFEISPIEDFTGKNLALYLEDYTLGTPKYSVDEAIAKGTSHAAPLKVKARLLNKETGENLEQEVFLGDVPLMTASGTFIINGIERVVVNQLTRSPGVFYTAEVEPATGRLLFSAELRPTRGSWLEFETGKNDVIGVKIDRKRKIAVTTFLRAIGLNT